MHILLTGATGFIGQRLAVALAARGHRLTCAVRDPAAARASGVPGELVALDFARATAPADWQPLLGHGTDAAVNAVGILREHAGARFDTLHVRAPTALFDACARAGVPRVVQLSALGADEQARSAYHRSKRAADEHLLGLAGVEGVVVQPSLVFGPGGASARLFTRLAALPLVPVPGNGGQRVQPIHVDDAVEALVAVVERGAVAGRRCALVGPQPVTLASFLLALRQSMGLGPARLLRVPMPLMRGLAAAGARLPGALLDREALDMLERGNTAPADATRALLGGRAPRAPGDFVGAHEAPGLRLQARLAWLLPLLRTSIAVVWIATGIVSLGVYPVSESYALLARVHVHGALAPVALYGAAALDLALGAATLAPRRPRALWWAQIGLILAYTALITVFLPEFWLHPYGPLLKNLPMLAALVLLLVLDDEGR